MHKVDNFICKMSYISEMEYGTSIVHCCRLAVPEVYHYVYK